MAFSGSPVFLVALVGPVVLWHPANPETQRQAGIQLIYEMDDGCTVGYTGGTEEVPSVQVGRSALAIQCLLGNPSKKTRERCVALQQKVVFVNSLRALG